MDHTTALIQKSHDGDEEARVQLVEENVGLIWCVAKRFYGRGVEPEDLFQIGSIGLLKAIDKFDLSFEVKFSTYAVPMMCTLGKKKGKALQNGRKPSNIKAFGVLDSTSTKRC